MNKKGGIKTLLGVILAFSVVIFIFVFGTIGLKQIYTENIITPVKDGFTPLVSSATETVITSYSSFYSSAWFDFDLFFLLFILTAIIGTLISAYKETKMGWRSFVGYVTIGTYVFLLMLTFITNLTDWLFLNFYYNLFDLTGVDTPIIDFFINNVKLISFIWFLAILLVNQFDVAGIIKRDSDAGVVEE